MTAKTHLVNKSELRIIPAIDIINGKCVRLTKGDYTTQKIYRDNPLDVAKEFEDNGIKILHLVDLDGAKSKHIVNYHILNEIATKKAYLLILAEASNRTMTSASHSTTELYKLL